MKPDNSNRVYKKLNSQLKYVKKFILKSTEVKYIKNRSKVHKNKNGIHKIKYYAQKNKIHKNKIH